MKSPAWLRRWRSERHMNAEMRFHLDSLAREYVRQGLNVKEAQQRAHREFGPLELAKDECRDDCLRRCGQHAASRYPLFCYLGRG